MKNNSHYLNVWETITALKRVKHIPFDLHVFFVFVSNSRKVQLQLLSLDFTSGWRQRNC